MTKMDSCELANQLSYTPISHGIFANEPHDTAHGEAVDESGNPPHAGIDAKITASKLALAVTISAVVLMLGAASVGFPRSQQLRSRSTLAKQSTRDLVSSASVKTPDFCKKVNVNMTELGDPSYRGAEKDWPTPICQDAYTSISKLLTKVPTVAHGIPDIRSTYHTAVGRSTILQAYVETLLDADLMTDLQQKTSGCSLQEFTETKEQIQSEVMSLQRVSGYYGKMTDLITGLGATMQRDLLQNMEVLMESAQEETTTTTTKATHKGWKIFKDVFSISTDVLGAAGACMGVPGLSDAIHGAGAVLTASVLVATSAQGITSTSRTIHNSRHSSGTATNSGVNDAGAHDDDAVDTENVDLMQQSTKMVHSWQRALLLQRDVVIANYGRLMAALPLYESCELGEEEIQLAVDASSPLLDWFSLSLVLPSKYNIFMQRGYDERANVITCPSQQCSPGSLPGGCYSATSNYSNTNFYPVGQDKNPVGRGYLSPTSHQFWLGEVGKPSAGPPASFWRYLLREDGPVLGYLMKQKGFNMHSGNADTAGSESCDNCCPECEALSDALMLQCSLIPKTYVPAGDITMAANGGRYAYPSAQTSTCNIFGAPWIVNTLADCGGQWVSNTFYCAADKSTCSNQEIANFNTQVFVPEKPHHYAPGTNGLVGCCQPGKEFKSFGCDFPICDCSSLAAIKELADSDAGNSVGRWLITENSIWWGKCKSQIDSDYSNGDLNNGPNPTMMTSLGFSWQYVYENYHELKQLSEELKQKGLQDYQQLSSQQVADVKTIISIKKTFAIATCDPWSYAPCNQMNGEQMCQGGGGPQPCNTCYSVWCNNYQCSCYGD
eukprot:TRINITY_DN15154_c0_g1_i1.p1 TRINITY_DN15154_c0_g1~~TRINITY_DN15154_c0_g1_i1.p1  ORF type:complete len:835 (-),score=58.48 TRINITY_DN15154_c0_g1_i1:199-2703(-)